MPVSPKEKWNSTQQYLEYLKVFGSAGLVPPKDTQALKEAIEYMLERHRDYSPEKISQLVGERFSNKAVGKVLDEVYKGLMWNG